MKKDAKWVAKVLNQLGYPVTYDRNYSNPAIEEVISGDGTDGYTLSYLPEKEKNWAGLNSDEDGWGWGICNDVDGYLLGEKSYQDNILDAMTDFMIVLTMGEKALEDGED